jgi:hypothetical protein
MKEETMTLRNTLEQELNEKLKKQESRIDDLYADNEYDASLKAISPSLKALHGSKPNPKPEEESLYKRARKALGYGGGKKRKMESKKKRRKKNKNRSKKTKTKSRSRRSSS